MKRLTEMKTRTVLMRFWMEPRSYGGVGPKAIHVTFRKGTCQHFVSSLRLCERLKLKMTDLSLWNS